MLLYYWEPERLLTDESGDILDVPPTIGLEALGRVGEFEQGAVYVRNHAMETDYEVIVRRESYYDYEMEE